MKNKARNNNIDKENFTTIILANPRSLKKQQQH